MKALRAVITVFCAVLVALGCESEKRVVRYKPFFANLEGASGGNQTVGDMGLSHDPTVVEDEDGIIEMPDGGKIFVAKTMRQLMGHLVRTLEEGDDDLVFEQIVSERAKGEYRVRDQDPWDMVDYLYEHEKDIRTMFNRMPMGEYSPTVVLKRLEDGGYCVQLTGQAARDSKLTRLWVVMEHGNWRLLWID